MAVIREKLELSPKSSGMHLITSEIVKLLPKLAGKNGLLHLFLQHTSASLSINENSDPNVRRDLAMALDHIVPESLPYQHTEEGVDDMPAHVKSSLLGCEVTIPIAAGELMLGTWQGVYLCEHREHAGSRKIVATFMGE